MRIHALALLVPAGCAATPRESYPVDAVAHLEPGQRDRPRVIGEIELLGTGTPLDIDLSTARTVAAYRVRVFDGLPHAVSLVSGTACIEPATGPPDPLPFQYLGVIRYIGNEAHFFTQDVMVGDHTIDIDTETAIAYASPTDHNKRMVIVSEFAHGGAPVACGVLTWR